MEINKTKAYGIVRKIDKDNEIAVAKSKDGQTLEFKIKFKVKKLSAQDVLDLC